MERVEPTESEIQRVMHRDGFCRSYNAAKEQAKQENRAWYQHNLTKGKTNNAVV